MTFSAQPSPSALSGARRGINFDHALEDTLRADVIAGSSAVTAARHYRGLTAIQLAEGVGLSIDRLDAMESGEPLSKDEISRISQTLNIPPALLSGNKLY